MIIICVISSNIPYVANATQKLSKDNCNENQAVFLKMHCVIKYKLDTINQGLKFELLENEKEPWNIVCISDSNNAGDLFSRSSVTEFLLCI